MIRAVEVDAVPALRERQIRAKAIPRLALGGMDWPEVPVRTAPNDGIRHSNEPTPGTAAVELPAIIFSPFGIGCNTLLSFMYAYKPVL